MRFPRAAWRVGAGIVTLAALAWLAGCAPGVRVTPLASPFQERYARARAARAARLDAYTAALLVRIDGRATGKLPGLTANLALGAPDRARVRLSWLLGTALDVCAGGDSLLAWLPSRRTALALDDAGDSLGVHAPVALLARALGATWAPPESSWRAAAHDSANAPLRWLEQGDSLALTLSAEGLPAEVRIARPEGAVRVRYTDWERWDGIAWPHHLELADERGWVRIRLEMTEPHHAGTGDPRLFTLTLPHDAQRIDWNGLRALLGLDEEER